MRFNGTSSWVWMPRLNGVGIVAAIGTSVLAASAYAPVASGMPAAHGHDAAAWPRSDDAHEDTASGNKPDKALDEKADKASGKTESNPKAAEDAKSASKDKNGKQDKGTPKAKDPSEKDEKEDSDKQAESEKSKSDKEKSEKETSSKEKSDKTKPEKTKSDKAKPKKAKPDKAKPDKAKPKKAKPEKTESDKTKSDKATPDQRTSKTRAGKPAAAGAAGRATTTTRQKGQLKLDPAIQARIDQLVGHRRAGRAAASTRSGAHAPVGGDAKARSGAEQDAKAAPWRPGQPRPAQPHQPTPPKPKPTAPPAAGADQDQIVPVPSDAGRAPPGKPDDTADAGSAAADEADDAPLLPEEDTRPPEARTYRFSIKNGTHAQLLDGFARQAGIPIIGAPPNGQVQDLVTTEEMSYDAALNRVRMLLFKFKPNEPYWLKRYEDHFEVIRVNDMLRLLEPWQMFASVEDFRAADFPSEGLALVVYTPTSGSVSDLEMVRDFLPDYVRVTAIPDKNQLTIFALSRDIEKYLGLIDFFTGGGDGDVRPIERIELTYILPTQAMDKLNKLMELSAGTVGRGRASAPKSRGKRGAAATNVLHIPELPVNILADDDQGVLIVRAMQGKIDEMKRLLKYIDVDTESRKPHTLIAVEHSDPNDLVQIINQVMEAEGGKEFSTPGKRTVPKRRGKKRRAADQRIATRVAGSDVVLIPMPTMSSIVVLADEEGVARVRELVAMFDVETDVGPVRVAVSHVGASAVTTTLQSVLGGGGRGAAASGPKIVPEASDEAIWVSGSRKDVDEVYAMLETIDVPGAAVVIHVVHLEHQAPSFVANMLRQYASDAAPAPRRPQGKRKGAAAARRRVPVPGKFTDDDANGLLYVLCTEDEWTEFKPIIDQLEGVDVGAGTVVRLAVEHIDPSDAVSTLATMLDFVQHGASAQSAAGMVPCLPVDHAILVQGGNQTQLDRIKTWLAQIDKPSKLIERTFAIRHADPSELTTGLKTLVGGRARATPPKRTRKGRQTATTVQSEDLTIVQMGRSLVVRTTPEKMEQVEAFITQHDVPPDQPIVRIFDDFPAGADMDEIATSVRSALGSGGPSRRRPGAKGSKGALAGGAAQAEIIAQPNLHRLVVIAEAAALPRIEQLIDVFRHDVADKPVARTYGDFPAGADVVEIANNLRSALGDAGAKRGRGPAKGPRGANAPAGGGVEIISQPNINRLVVIAPPTDFPRIEKLLNLLRDDVADAPTVRVFEDFADGVDVLDVAADLRTALGVKATRPRPKGSPGGSSARAAAMEIIPQPNTNRLVVIAPTSELPRVAELVDLLGTDAADEPVVNTVTLAHASPDEIIEVVTGLMGGGAAPGRAAPRKPGARPKRGPAGALADFTIIAAPGGGAVVLKGRASDVAEAEGYIARFDTPDAVGKQIKIYHIAHADLDRLAEVIMTAVDVPAAPKGRAGRRQRPPRGAPPEPSLDEDMFTTTKTHRGAAVFLQTDELAGTMLAVASASDIAHIDQIVGQFDQPDSDIETAPAVPSFTYTLKHADAFDASYELSELLDYMWRPADMVPKVDYIPLLDDILFIEYPDESRFPDIEKLIREHVDIVKPEDMIPVRLPLAPPAGATVKETAEWLRNNHPELDIEIVKLGDERNIEDAVNRVLPPAKKGRPCVMPLSFMRGIEAIAVGLVGQDGSAEPANAEEPDAAQAAKQDETPVDGTGDDAPIGLDTMLAMTMLQDASPQRRPVKAAKAAPATGNTDAQQNATPDGQPRKDEDPALPAGTKLRLIYDEANNVLIVEGQQADVDGVEKLVEDMEEELNKFGKEYETRVYRVRYMDVNEAAELIDEVFNATKQQRARAAQMARAQQQLARAQQQAAARAAQRAQQGKGQAGKATPVPGQGGKGGVQIPQLAQPSVRIVPNPRDRTLIIRAKPNDYRDILELLAIIDQPQPIENELRTYPLQKLDAAEVEELLTDMLGLGATGARNAAKGRGKAGAKGGAKLLPQGLMQEAVTDAGPLGVFRSDITITSNPVANTVIAMAPRAALDYIGELITQLESFEETDRITKHYVLTHADVTGVAEYLSAHFEQSGAPGGAGTGRGRAKGRAGAQTRAASGPNAPPLFLPFPPLSMLSAHGTEAQIAEIDDLVAMLDVESEGSRFEAVTLANADADAVAGTLAQMFGGAAGGRGGPRRGAADASGPRFIGEAGTNVLFFAAPAAMREEILATIDTIQAQGVERTKPRPIPLEHATPSDVADAIRTAYGEGGRGRGGRRGGRGGGRGSSRFTVTGHDATKQLFVLAPDDATFEEVKALAIKMDQPREMGFDFKIYPLKFAKAREVHTMLNKLVTDYLRRVGSRDMEAFAVEVDDKTNSMVVLGSPIVFRFVEDALKTVDTPANASSPPGFLMVALKSASAQEVAGNITRLWSGRNLPEGEVPPQAEANRSLNMLIVRGTQAQIDQIKKEVIDPLEEHKPPALTTETITLQYAQPEAVAEAINKIFEDKRRAYQSLRGGGNVSALEFTVVVTPDVNTKQIIVQASDANMALVKTRVAELDREDVASGSATSIKIYPVKFADPNAVVNIIREWSRTRTMSGGRGRSVASRDVVTAVAEHATQSVVVTASETNHAIIKELIDGLDNESLATGKRKRHFIPLHFADADEVARKLTEVFRQTGVRRRRGDTGPAFIGEPKTNAIVASVNDAELTEVTELLASIDVESSEDTERTMKVHKMKFADPNGVINAINQTFRQNRRSAVRPEDQVVAVVDWGTQSVIITASEKNHAKIAELIGTLDDEKLATGRRNRYVLALHNANAEDVARQLVQVFRQGRRGQRGDPGPAFIAAPNTNSIIASVTEDELEDVASLLQDLDREPTEKTARTMVVYQIRYADPGGVVNAINQTYRGARGVRVRPEDQVVAVVDWGTQSVIVTASAENHNEIKALIDQIDREGTIAAKTEVVLLQYANADEVTRKLNEVYGRTRRRTRQGQDPLIITANPRGNSIVVRGSESDITKVKELIAAFDVESTLDERTTVAYPLKYADPGSINGVILNMFRWDRRTQVSPSEQVTSSVDWGTRSMIITASPKNHDVIRVMLEQVDKESTLVKELHTYKLEHGNAEDIARAVQQAYRGRRRTGRGEQPVQITGERATNTLIIMANENEMAELTQLIDQLDVEPEIARQRQLRSFALTYANPWSVRDAINNLFRGSRNPRDQVGAVPEGGSNAVIVSASPDNMKRVEDLITQLDQAGTSQRSVKIFEMEHAEAAGVARALNEVFVRSAPRTRGAAPITIAEVRGSKSIMVKAGESDMARIEEALAELDTASSVVGGVMRVVQLVQSDAEEMLTIMQEYLRKPGGRGRSPELSGDVRLSTMTQSNALVISGDKDEVDRLEGVVRDLDTSTENPNAPRMIRMTHVRASQILPTVEQMFSGGGRSSRRGRRGGGPQAPVLVANEPLNALIVRAGPADFAAIESIVAALDVEEGTVAETVKIVRVQPGPNIDDLASEIEDTVNRGAEATADQFPGMTVPRIVITPNKRTNSLLLAGSPQLFAQAEQLIHAMEEMGPSGGLAIRILDTPPNMSADELRQLIEQLTADDQGGSRARRGTARRGGRSAGRRSSGGRRTGRSSARRPSGRRRRP